MKSAFILYLFYIVITSAFSQEESDKDKLLSCNLEIQGRADQLVVFYRTENTPENFDFYQYAKEDFEDFELKITAARYVEEKNYLEDVVTCDAIDKKLTCASEKSKVALNFGEVSNERILLGLMSSNYYYGSLQYQRQNLFLIYEEDSSLKCSAGGAGFNWSN